MLKFDLDAKHKIPHCRVVGVIIKALSSHHVSMHSTVTVRPWRRLLTFCFQRVHEKA